MIAIQYIHILIVISMLESQLFFVSQEYRKVWDIDIQCLRNKQHIWFSGMRAAQRDISDLAFWHTSQTVSRMSFVFLFLGKFVSRW